MLVLAYLNSHFQTGLKNVLDRAILQHEEIHEGLAVPELRRRSTRSPSISPRKLMSVVVETPEGIHRLICKGAPEEVFQRCSRFELEGKIYPIDPLLIADLKEEYDELSADGFRVLAVAYKDMERQAAYSKDDEKDLILKGYVAFLDPPKDTAGPAIAALQEHGVAVKVLTGDNELVSRKICQRSRASPTDRVLLGGQVEAMSDAELAEAADKATLFARLSPAHKQRIIKRLAEQAGTSSASWATASTIRPALRAADVGISVDTAVDIAKESADIILLEKSLMVLEEGVLEGRKVFANILKYVRMGASSNFGNMFSVLGASVFVPFLPMTPIQILTNNLLYDFSQVPIPTDDVDPEQIAKPRPWYMGEIARFILFIGPCSSIFDYTTFFDDAVPLRLLGRERPEAHVALFQTGWFVESLLTQTLIIHVIRTNRIPFLQSRASWPLIVDHRDHHGRRRSGCPRSPIGPWLGFAAAAGLYWPLLRPDALLLRPADPGREDLADPQGLDIGLLGRRPRGSPGGHQGNALWIGSRRDSAAPTGQLGWVNPRPFGAVEPERSGRNPSPLASHRQARSVPLRSPTELPSPARGPHRIAGAET